MFPRVLTLCVIALASTAANAQWWSFAPRDYEECAARAETSAATNDARRSQIAECDSRFAGRRKIGGGYTYFDFMQNRSFDIAGPNPTPEELRTIDEEYIGYLERQRRSAIATAFLAKQRELTQADVEKSAPPKRAPVTTPAANTQRPAMKKMARSKAAPCGDESLSCSWSKFSIGVKNFLGFAKPAGGTRS